MKKVSTYHTRSRSKELNSDDIGNSSGWHKYKLALVDAHVREDLHRWYAQHIKQFLSCHAGFRISELSAEQVTLHLQQLDSLQFSEDWK